MLINFSNGVVLVAGISLCGISAWGFYAPQKLVQWTKDAVDAMWGIHFAVIIRLLLGAALLTAAPTATFPTAFLVIGWIAIAAAVGVLLMGRERLRKFLNWWIERFSPPVIRAWLLIAFAFGGFLIYGIA
jgi:hypothetical protein